MLRENKLPYPYWAPGIGMIFLVVWLLGISPPILEHLSFFRTASVIKFIYRFFCHGIPDRCPQIFSKPAVVCFRCTGIDLSFFLGCSLLFPLLRYYINWRKAMFISVIFAITLFAEWISEFFGFYKPTHLLQFLTGFTFGLSVSLLVCSLMDEALHSYEKINVRTE